MKSKYTDEVKSDEERFLQRNNPFLLFYKNDSDLDSQCDGHISKSEKQALFVEKTSTCCSCTLF